MKTTRRLEMTFAIEGPELGHTYHCRCWLPRRMLGAEAVRSLKRDLLKGPCAVAQLYGYVRLVEQQKPEKKAS